MQFTPVCLLCQQRAAQRLCPDCYTAIAHLAIGTNQCQQCALPLAPEEPYCGECLALPPSFDCAYIPYRYQYPLDYLVARYKFSSCLASGQLLRELFTQFIATYAPTPDIIIPTPLHWRSQFKRGYNQSLQLARAAAQTLDLPVSTKHLYKLRHTPVQHGLPRRERKLNLRQCFHCKPLQGQAVALVDDVVTTGTTARELSKHLLRAGAGSVHIWALARTPSARHTHDL
ncbi:ComF family protein [Gilvimarinus sp. SDUM040013]|uniref:ComF family protein n=1 Tax=Gilvimarinus gilvus TaxID=3058038 RepID=A0ABU4RTW0_9GAMM|nr:ComF family protein [Gilvimarinus sp. SDUM040013]MDO3386747.1 ComF family protein [Gilvimarinus sp. SDUM040013]MDX6848323.1 ComF family protein [Gilvimarinus sp. SDUM040013]